jgi:putative phosphoesterase
MHEQRPDIEHWFCAGDVVDMHKTLHYNEPVLRILSRLDIPSVMGNHDYRFRERHLHRLGEETCAHLEELPFSLDVRFAGNRIRIYHATPESREDFALGRAGKKTFRALFGQENADIIVIGHTHEPYVETIGDKQFINPGALGLPEEAPPSFCTLSENGSAEILYLEETT